MSSQKKTLNDSAWEKLFNQYRILSIINSEGQYIISANQIRPFREPRLMAKADTSEKLPAIFKENHLAILPNTRNSYVIANMDAYKNIELLNSPITHVLLPDFIQSINPNEITSESFAINTAISTDIFTDFLGDDHLHATVSGRMGSGKFEFKVYNGIKKRFHNIEVVHSQIEIDMAIEGIKSLTLIEAKLQTPSDFIVRQLYYPFRTWKNKIKKDIRNVFFVYSNGIFNLYEYVFEDINDYGSLYLANGKRYSIENTRITLQDVDKKIRSLVQLPEPLVPFPQADKFDRVIDLCFILLQRDLGLEEITEEYEFDIRQASYYSSAAIYLGLIEKSDVTGVTQFNLTDIGRQIFNLDYKSRQLGIINLILQHKVFYDVYLRTADKTNPLDLDSIVEIMKSNNLYKIESDETYRRRAQTIRSWIGWILGRIES